MRLCATRLRAPSLKGLVLIALSLTSCGPGDSGDTTSSSGTPPVTGTTVQVSVAATDPDGDQLHYRWAATDGTINNVDAPKTTWVVPRGSGIQFAYVVVSDNKGGYSESRAAVLTFDPPMATSTAVPAIIPAAPTGSSGFVWGSVYSESPKFGRRVYLPGVTVKLANGRSAVTDKKGQFFISNVADGSHNVTYTIPGRPETAFSSSATINATSPSSPAYFLGQVFPTQEDLRGVLQVAGSVRLADHSYCGIRNEFFTHSSHPNLLRGPVSGSAKLLDTANNPLSTSFPINHYGDFLIVRSPVVANTAAKVRITCEDEVVDSPTLTLPASGAVSVAKIILPNNRPTVTKMSVLLGGQEIGRPDLPKPRTLFTNVDGAPPRFGDDDLIAEIIHSPGDDAFFTYKGIDTRKSVCAYYRAIGAVRGCDDNGFPTGPQLTLDQWRSKFNLSPFPNGNPSNPPAPGGQEVRIQYINRSDLNLGRDMQAVKLVDGSIAYNVCNYAGPQDVTNRQGAPKEIGLETQADIDLSIDNIRRGIGLIVCVAMDYSAIPGINADQPFTKFYTFGPTGSLLLSVSLDGRREKFMPGACTSCHGGDAYGGQFPEDGSGLPDLKSRWQPFDMANLDVRSGSAQDLADINVAVKILNKRLVGTTLESLTTDRTKKLIDGWYADGGVVQNSDFIPPLSYIPSSLSNPPGTPTQSEKDLYQRIIQPGCQTCHAAQKTDEKIDLPHRPKICDDSKVLEQNHTMPNSIVPFERFWLDENLPRLLGCGSTPKKHPPL